MNYPTVPMLARHTGKCTKTIHQWLARIGIAEREPGVKGLRIPLKAANDALRKQWPEVGAYREPDVAPKAARPWSIRSRSGSYYRR